MITDFLKSEYDVAIYHSKALKAAAVQLSQVPETGAGETNHGINDICCSIYNETQTYSNPITTRQRGTQTESNPQQIHYWV